ncbi:MAG: hypothetical protein MJY72_05560 [Bacteroidales bacterium]|nr:hypothetical protein [Bacteroidales bacterium]
MSLFKKISVIFLLTLVVWDLFAQADLPRLADDPAVSRGTLPSGIGYVLVTNQSVKGLADITILQRACQTEIELPTNLLASLGIGPGKDGYLRRVDNGIRYDFRDCPFINGASCVDSLLSAAFRIMKSVAESEPSCGTTGQTIIIAGDIDKKSLQSKILMLSDSISLHQGATSQTGYRWDRIEEGVFVASDGGDLARLMFTYHLPASALESNNTVVNVMADQFEYVLGIILESSVKRELRLAGISCSNLEYAALRSDAHLGDDLYTLSLEVGKDDAEAAVGIVASVLDSVVGGNVTLAQYEWAYRKMVADEWARAHEAMSNAEYVDRCVNAVLYNASLATRKSEVEFYRTRAQTDEERLGFFNMFTASLSDEGYLEVVLDGAPQGLDSEKLRSLVRDNGRVGRIMDLNYADTLGFPSLQKRKIKDPVMKKDILTGGNSWTYSNGLNIIYRKMQTDGLFYFSWLLRGAEEKTPSIREMAVGQYPGDYFLNLLAANGIEMEFRGSSKGISLEGRADATRLQLLFKSLQLVFASMPELGAPSGGPLVLIGDRTDYSVQKTISQLVGGFDMSSPERPRKSIPVPVELDTEDETIAFQALYSCDFFLSGDNFMAADIAERLLSKALVEALDGSGYHAQVEGRFVTEPKDRYALHIKVRAVDGMAQTESLQRVRTLVRGVMSDMARKDVPAARLDVEKKLLSGSIALAQKTPGYWTDAVRVRFLESRDMVTKYADKIAQVSPAKLRELFANLQVGGMLEYTSDK